MLQVVYSTVTVHFSFRVNFLRELNLCDMGPYINDVGQNQETFDPPPPPPPLSDFVGVDIPTPSPLGHRPRKD